MHYVELKLDDVNSFVNLFHGKVRANKFSKKLGLSFPEMEGVNLGKVVRIFGETKELAELGLPTKEVPKGATEVIYKRLKRKNQSDLRRKIKRAQERGEEVKAEWFYTSKVKSENPTLWFKSKGNGNDYPVEVVKEDYSGSTQENTFGLGRLVYDF